jgi:hypothetical protein
MADQQLKRLKQGVETWNQWREKHLAACRREQCSSHSRRQSSVGMVHGTGRSASMERGRRYNRGMVSHYLERGLRPGR